MVGNSKLAERSQLGAVEVQQPDTDDTNYTQTAEQTGALINAEVVKQRLSEEHTATSKSASEEVVCSEETGCVHGIAERDIDKDTLHHNKDCKAVNGDADGGNDPVDGGSSCPGKEEQANGRTERGDESWNESAFLDGPASLGDARVHVEVEVAEVDAHADDTGDENAEEDEADLAEVHAVVDGVDTGEHLKDWWRVS
jgi:hypothetical protein